MTIEQQIAIEAAAVKGPFAQSHRKKPDGWYDTEVYTLDGHPVAVLTWYPKPLPDGWTGTYRAENAAEIVCALNHHRALLEAAELAKEALPFLPETTRESLCAALAAMEEIR